nr:DUF4754 family protein [Escherichia coli]
MGKEYKTLINKALERFYFRLSASGAHAERAARDSLTRAIRSLYDVAFYADDLDALNELSELICAAECGRLSARGTVKTKNSVMGGFSVSGVNC